MKLNLLTKSIVGLSIVTSAIAITAQYSYAQAQTRFACDSTRTPTTTVQTEKGTIPLIRWRDRSFLPPFNSEQRCQIVSKRFQKFDSNGTLKYIKADEMNGKPVMCVAAYKGGSCLPDGILVTFTKGTDANDALLIILDFRLIPTNRICLNSDEFCPNYHIDLDGKVVSEENGKIYVNVEEYISIALTILNHKSRHQFISLVFF